MEYVSSHQMTRKFNGIANKMQTSRTITQWFYAANVEFRPILYLKHARHVKQSIHFAVNTSIQPTQTQKLYDES